MKNKIKTNLRELLSVLDARAYVTIFTSEKDHYCTMKVMNLLCEDELMRLNGKKAVTGIAICLGIISIQLEY
jgi:hypothetical protein